MMDTSLYPQVCFLVLLEMLLLADFRVQSTGLEGARLTPKTDPDSSLTIKELLSSLTSNGRMMKQTHSQDGSIPSEDVNGLQPPEDIHPVSSNTYCDHEGTSPRPFQTGHVERRDAPRSTISQGPKVRLSICLRNQSRKWMEGNLDLPDHAQSHLADDWMDEVARLSNFSLPPPCVDALCHPAVNVSFRILTNTSANSTWVFMAMWGQAVLLIDQCRVHLQGQSHLRKTVDHEGNTLYQTGDHFKLIFFRNQSCHYTDSLLTISALTNLQVLGPPPPLCLQNILCSPSSRLEIFQRSPGHWIWIPSVLDPPPIDDLANCFHLFRHSQHQEVPVIYVNISTSPIQHDLVLFSSPQCYVKRLDSNIVSQAVVFGTIPPSSCLSILCDQRFRIGFHEENTTYIMVFGQDVSLLNQCRSQLSSDSRSTKTDAIKGFTIPISPVAAFFLPDMDCHVDTSASYAPVFVSIAIRNVTIPEPCLPLLCSSDDRVLYTGENHIYVPLGSNNLAASCFDALTPNPKTNDVVRILAVSPMVDLFQISPKCARRSLRDLDTLRAYSLILSPSVSFPDSCYSHICYGAVGSIEERKRRVVMYYIVGSKQNETGCYSSLLTSNRGIRVATDSKNCSFVLIQMPSDLVDTNITNMITVSEPKCQVHESMHDPNFGHQYWEMFANNFIDSRNDIQNVFFDCLAKKIRDTYGIRSLFPLSIHIYSKGVQRPIPDTCIRLACDPAILISYHFQLPVVDDFSPAKQNAYITFYSITAQNVEGLTHCNEALNTSPSGNSSTPLSRETLIPSNVDMRGLGFNDLPRHLFLVFPPSQCVIVQNIIKATVISYFLTIHKDFAQKCVEGLICNSNIEVAFTKHEFIAYVVQENVYDDDELNGKCFGYIDNSTDSKFPQNFGVRVMSVKHDPITSIFFKYILLDFSIKPNGRKGRTLVSKLLLGNHEIEHLASCMRCMSQSYVELVFENVYLMVPYGNETKHCQKCHDSGTRVPYIHGLVLILIDHRLALFMLYRNATLLREDAMDSPEANKWYLYFVMHRLDTCARLDRENFKTFVSHVGYITSILLIQNEGGLPCLEQMKNASKLSCFQSRVGIICRDYVTRVAILYLPKCNALSFDKLDILSNFILNSLENALTILNRIVDLCKPSVHVASYVIPNDEFYFETSGHASNLNNALQALQHKWRLKPTSLCVSLLQPNHDTCASASSSSKIEELVQSQTGRVTEYTTEWKFVYQCITYVHSNATLQLYRPIYINFPGDEIFRGCKNSFVASEEKVLGIIRNGTFYLWVGDLNLNIPNIQSDGALKLVHTGPCLPLKNDINLATATASVAQNNTACLRDICNGSFLLSDESENHFSFIGPLSTSLYRSSCFKSLPPRVWRRIDAALRAGRATLNKFWPGCFYDFIILSNAKDAKIDDWNYLSTACKAREIVYFLFSLILTIITIVGNIVIIYTLFYLNEMNDASYRLRINLAFSDLLVGLFVESRAVHNHLSLMTGELTLYQLGQVGIYNDFQAGVEKFVFGFDQIRFIRTGYDAFCGFAFSTSSFVSLTFMSLMTLERFLMVAYQRIHDMVFRQTRLTGIVVGTWFGGILFSVLLLQKEEGHDFVGYFDPVSKLTTSLPSGNIRSASFITFCIVVVIFSLTSLLVAVVTVLTFWKFATSHERLEKHKIYVSAPTKEADNQKLRVVLTYFVGGYLLSCVPLAVGSAFNVFLLCPACHQIIWWIYLSSSAWNCYLYNFRLPKFRKEIGKAFLSITIAMGHFWAAFAEGTRELLRSVHARFFSSDDADVRVRPPDLPQQRTSSV